jgi:hypothetical protein
MTGRCSDERKKIGTDLRDGAASARNHERRLTTAHVLPAFGIEGTALNQEVPAQLPVSPLSASTRTLIETFFSCKER